MSYKEDARVEHQLGEDDDNDSLPKCKAPTLLSKLSYASYIYAIKGAIAPLVWLRDWKEYFIPPEGAPNIVKTYECRPSLPVRIFFPSSYDQTSPASLPTLLTIHGGGFCVGNVRDDDEWNRAFADAHDVLVIALNYSKAPGSPFPTALHDIEALLLAVLADESLPVDRSLHDNKSGLGRTALLGFSAGGNLALSAAQLPSVRAHPLAPAAVVSVYGALDLSVPPAEKLANRPWKAGLPAPRGTGGTGGDDDEGRVDALSTFAPTFEWSLPPYVALVAAELDMLAHESWRAACRLGNEQMTKGGEGGRTRVVPDRESREKPWRVCGREDVGGKVGELEREGDERFAWEDYVHVDGDDGGEERGVKWLLVPDVNHGFDNPQFRGMLGGDEETIKDAVLKTKAYQAELGRWLRERVWGL
ncbi:Alpha/Beta hydrolase protein [Bombardia bombarda]|uniref:Alpha/Beta hydrolase protein n=1 Tax=Bombardia bombarda TaxID=252184 RepID=A0AA39WBM0_9PEZI|nr:Alpha/Beta hydrolase protein [Bombardia bombarda]